MTDVIELDDRLRRLADELNHALIEQVAAVRKLTMPAWRAAFEAVPRHLFAPRFTLPQNLGGQTLDGTDVAQREHWLRAVYQNEALLTDIDDRDIPTTSCSAPSVVATMLESSQASEGDTVLEIGTGTGWTAGLLAHRLGSDSIISVDISAQCVTDARDRLERLGLAPTLVVTDGYLGHPARAPYDRIIATASIRKLPPAWLDQTRPGGTILIDLRGDFAGSLALFTIGDDRSVHGQFLPETANFMPLRSTEQPFQQLPELSSRAVREPGEQRTTSLDPAALRTRSFAFLAQLALPGTVAGHVTIKNGEKRGPMYFCLTDPRSQAWARVTTDTTTDRQVIQGGNRRLWDELEAAHDLWKRLGQPRPDEFTITIAQDGDQIVDLPGADRSWSLPL
ncbi:protein-L-isoaspartate O-methyltransferase [Prauserella shujinwangii]|uniref:Protein-L-isoaspartate O-methyltransferase n=1 Tax=Prauserella shujinwangii TaxID=1453103 RepID=A0A2T0LN90_9PSEU|nr:methyltransferase domain-containing protein [Prauserella shujinwangii]PRX44655.1 protein-L-isoaspartate O-methyltransferase [Prauserella shujinwangii]